MHTLNEIYDKVGNGAIEINQTKALAGDITPGDAPGFPVSITQPGSYRLTGNLTVPVDVHGIEVTTNDVKIDLNGFAIIGPTVCSGTPLTCSDNSGRGIYAEDWDNISVFNGTVRGMGGGVVLGDNSRVERVQAISNHGAGISARGGSLVTGVIASYNGSVGIGVSGGVVSGNTTTYNGNFGIYVSGVSGATVLGNLSSYNGDYGLLSYSGRCGYANNVLISNNGLNSTNPQSYNCDQMGPNVCGSALCP
jgi:hypothetical protein